MPHQQTILHFNIDCVTFEGDPNEMVQAMGEEYPKDVWDRIGDHSIVRRHNTPRLTLFDPSKCTDVCPIDLDLIDVYRTTITDIQDSPGEQVINDTWDGLNPEDERSLSQYWTGRTEFAIVSSTPGYENVHGRWTRIQKTDRPRDIPPELWKTYIRAQKKEEIERWGIMKAKIERAWENRRLVSERNKAEARAIEINLSLIHI